MIQIILYVEVSTTALDFFLAHGFKIDGETNNVVCGQVAKQYLMSWDEVPMIHCPKS